MQKITEQQIKTITKEIVKLSKNNTPIKHSDVLEVISHTLGYRDYNGLSNSLKKEDTSIIETTDLSIVSEISESAKILAGIKNVEKKLETQKNTPSTENSRKFQEELKTLRRSYSKTAQVEDAKARKTRAEEERILTEKKQYENALQKFNNHYYSVLEVVSRSLGDKDYNSLSNSLKKEVPVSENMAVYVQETLDRANRIIRVINIIKEELESKKNTLSTEEIQKIQSKLKILNSFHSNVLNKHEIAKKELKMCPKCNGQGEFILGLSSGASDSMYYDYEYGDFSAVAGMLETKECFWCFGTGKITNKRIKQVENIKREHNYSKQQRAFETQI